MSAGYLLKTAFEYEIRNYIDIQIYKLNQGSNTETIKYPKNELEQIKEYLQKRIKDMKI